MVWGFTFLLSLTSGLYSQLQFHPQLLRKICLGSHGGLASSHSKGANQSQQGINSSLNLAFSEESTLSSWPSTDPISLWSTEVDCQCSHTCNKTQTFCKKLFFHLKITKLTRLSNVNKWVWEVAKKWRYVALISSVTAYYFRGWAGCPSIRAKGNTCRLYIPVCVCGDPWTF